MGDTWAIDSEPVTASDFIDTERARSTALCRNGDSAREHAIGDFSAPWRGTAPDAAYRGSEAWVSRGKRTRSSLTTHQEATQVEKWVVRLTFRGISARSREWFWVMFGLVQVLFGLALRARHA